MEEKMKKEKLNLDDVAHMWFWENDHRKSNKIFVAPKVGKEAFIGGVLREDYGYEVIEKTPEITKLIRDKGARFYTCDDDYEDGDDYRYGYYYNPSNKDGLDFEPLDQMEGDGHVHMFYKNEEGKYKPL